MNTEPNQQVLSDYPPEDTGDCCQPLSRKIDDTVSRTKDYVRQNPVPVILGALAFGAALGYTIVMARREEPTFRERFADEPLQTAREAIYAVLAPVAHRLHDGYGSARQGAEKALDKLQGRQPVNTVESWFNQLGRVSSNLKFW